MCISCMVYASFIIDIFAGNMLRFKYSTALLYRLYTDIVCIVIRILEKPDIQCLMHL